MATSPYQIAGNLPFGGGGGSMDFSGSPAGLAASYKGAYGDALAMNAANYGNIMAGFQQTANAQQQAQQGIIGGYGDLQNRVLGSIQGVQQTAANDINANYAAQSGAQAQSLINRGLGNTTVQNSVQRGLTFDQNRALLANQNQFAQTQAGYMAQLGLADLAYQGQAQQQNAALAQSQLGFMNSVNAAYPNAGLYAQLAGQGGAERQAQQDRELIQARTNTGIPGGQIGYIGSGGGFSAPASFGGGYGVGGGGYGGIGGGYNSALTAPAPVDPWAGYLGQSEDTGPGFFQGTANDVAAGVYGTGYEDVGGGYSMNDNGELYYEY